MQDQPAPPADAERVREIQLKIAAAMDGHEMEDCMPALLACVESGAMCSTYPLALTFTANHLRRLTERLDGQIKWRARPR